MTVFEDVWAATDLKSYVDELREDAVQKSSTEAGEVLCPQERSDRVARLARLGLAEFYRGEYQRSFSALTRALNLTEGSASELSAEVNHYFAMASRACGYLQKAELHLLVAQKMFQLQGDRAGEARVVDTLGSLMGDLGRRERSRSYYEHSLVLKREVGDRKGEAITYGNLGRVLFSEGRLNDAIGALGKDLAIARELYESDKETRLRGYHRRTMAIATLSMAEALVQLAEMEEEAESCFRDALALNVDNNDLTGQCLVHLSHSGSLRQRGRSEEALAEVNAVLELLPDDSRHAGVRGQALRELATVRETLHEYPGAWAALEQSLEHLEAAGYSRDRVEVLIQLARLMEMSGKRAEALDRLNEALEVAATLGQPTLIAAAELAMRKTDESYWFRLVSNRFSNFDPSSYPFEVPVLLPGRGERKELSVLFADVSGYTRMMARREDAGEVEEMLADLNEILAMMAEAVHRFGGQVDKYIGDCLMGVFLPASPNQASTAAFNAVKACLEIRSGFEAFNKARDYLRSDSHEHTDGGLWPPVLQVHIGIATGVVTLGNVGSSRRLSRTVIGDAVNMASRLEGKAAHGEIMIDQTTYDLVSNLVVAERRDLDIKGKEGRKIPGWVVSRSGVLRTGRRN